MQTTETLATHLEVALACSPQDTLSGLQDTDGSRRRKAAEVLARYLADRLSCFEFSFERDARAGVGHPSLFPE